MTNPAQTIPATTEIAYRIPGKGSWKRRTFATEEAATKFLARLRAKEGDDVEVRWAN